MNSPEPTTSIIKTEQIYLQALTTYQAQWPALSTAANVYSSAGKMHKVSPQLRMTEKKKPESPSVYDPIMVSLGPYHHGTQKDMFCRAEEFKHSCLHAFTDGVEKRKVYYYGKILDEIDEIRARYVEVSTIKDEALALMMLLDSCFILRFMERCADDTLSDWYTSLGMVEAVKFTARDIMVLENQVPFSVLKLLIGAKYDGENQDRGRTVVRRFLTWILSVEFEHASIPEEDTNTPIHILEACWRVMSVEPQQISTTPDSHHHHQHPYKHHLISLCPIKFPNLWPTKRKSTPHLPLTTDHDHQASEEKTKYTSCTPVMDLRIKGISFRPSSSHSLKDIRFKSGYVYGKLHLPVRSISEQTQLILSNMIAFEISRDGKTDLTVLSYTHFMKSLIETPADVKQLQENDIIRFNRFANQEEVVNLFKSIDTFGLDNVKIHADVMRKVGEHCRNRWKTWMAELFHSKLKSPWTIIGLAAATLLVILTFQQTWYTINPV